MFKICDEIIAEIICKITPKQLLATNNGSILYSCHGCTGCTSCDGCDGCSGSDEQV